MSVLSMWKGLQKNPGNILYMLYQLKRAGISQNDLVTVYTYSNQSVVRRVLEYACPVWHTNLQNYLSDNIEMIRGKAIKSILPKQIMQIYSMI